MLLITQILPDIFKRRLSRKNHRLWVIQRFKDAAGGIDLQELQENLQAHKLKLEAQAWADIDYLDINASKFEAAHGAHTGKPGKKADMGTKSDREKQYTVAEFIDMGFEHIQWDGVTPIPIVDCCGRIIAILVGQPGRDYPEELQEAFGIMQKEGENAGLSSKATDGPHKRGAFPAYN
ncbi:hypothetical protein EV359DRAFT_84566 [Lentinula novae-zelandiae]|nr:hypothetical protein EV359DRAFT_84566 [Lentinula novae-zelandiae]